MRKKIIIVSCICIILLSLALYIAFSNKFKYVIKVSLIDDNSPDRVLTVYDNNNEKIDVKRIEYIDGKLLCNGYNTTVYYGDIKDETTLKIVLKDDTEAKAKVINEEVNK